ncbi:MAG: TonB-dependent receptor [Phycisphaerae bacterium]|nr:TonB-dependent receptor [Phycisphaerae bacterium]
MLFKKSLGNAIVSIALSGLVCLVPLTSAGNEANRVPDLTSIPFEELMDMDVSLVSKQEEKQSTAPASVFVLSNEDIRRSGHQSIPEVLRMVPGIHVAKIDSNKWAITSRGFNSMYADKLLMLIDGRSVYTPLYSGVYWDVQDVMLEDVERIEVVKGPGGTLWGANAVNGIINIITKNAKNTQGSLLTAGAGTEEKGFSSLRHGGSLGKNAYYRVYAKYFNRDEAVYANGDRANDGYDSLREGFRIDWDRSEQDQITLQGDYYGGHSAQKTNLTSSTSNFTKDENVTVRGSNVLSRWTRAYSDDSDVSLQFYYDRTERDSTALGETRDTFDFDFQHHINPGGMHHLMWGLGYRYTGDHTTGSYTITFDPSSHKEEVFSGFVQDQVTLVEDVLKLTVGTKAETNEYTGNEFQPNARLLWTPDAMNAIWASWTRAVVTPSRAYTHMTNKYVTVAPNTSMQTIGNNDLKSQEVMSCELGYRVKPAASLSFDLSLFYSEYDNLVTNETTSNSLVKRLGDKMNGETFGSEIVAHWLVNDSWKVTGGYSLLEMRLHTDNSSTDTTTEIKKEKTSPHTMFHLNSQFNPKDDLEMNATLYYVGSVPHYSIPSYTRLDVGLIWHASQEIDISVVGQNLLDSSHPEFGDSAPFMTEVQRGLFGKMTWRF